MTDTYARRALAVALVGAPVLWLGAEACSPKLESNAARQVAVIAQHQDRWYGYTLLLVLGTMLFVPAVLAVMRITRAESTRLSLAGGILLCFGTLVAIGDAMTQLVFWQAGAEGADRRQMAALMDRFDNAGGASLIFGPGGLAFLVGSVLLTIALLRTARVPSWAAVLFGVGLVVQVVGFTSSSVPMIAASNVISLVAMAALARVQLGAATAPSAQATDRPAAGVRTAP